jgi:Txe/YoeB family toxin of Txe-Axe toxin-antitoxin module
LLPKPSKEYEVTVYEFASDFAALSSEAKEQMNRVLSRLQKNPYDPYLLREPECIVHDGELYEYRLHGGHRIFWKVRVSGDRMEIDVVTVE